MKYFKNTELAALYKISEKSVRNWTEAAQNGKLGLQLYEHRNKHYIANTSQNTALIEQLVEKGKKYKNARGVKKLEPKKVFYEYYDDRQILDIISNLSVHSETPLQYTYVDGGSDDWDKYAHRLHGEKLPNILNCSIEMLRMLDEDIMQLLQGYDKINVVDLGPGNGLPIRPTLQRLLGAGRLNRYIPVDISKDMLQVLERNMKSWFGDAIKLESHVRDLSYERFNDILSADFADEKTVNLVFFMGGTLDNFRMPNQVLQVINNSLGPNDVFITSGYMDTAKNRRYFDYYNADRKVPVQDGLILDFLNIDESLYDVEQVFNENKRARSISIRPKVDISIKFKVKGGTRTLELRKNEQILIWRHWHKTILEAVNQLEANSFDVMLAVKSADGQYSMCVSKIKTGIDN